MNTILQAIGTVGGILFATACVPMAWKAFREGNSFCTPASTIWTFIFANLLFGTYLFGTVGPQLPAFLSIVELVSWGIVAWYYKFPRMKTKSMLRLGYCTRDDGHDGPCNGWPRSMCGVGNPLCTCTGLAGDGLHHCEFHDGTR